MAGQYPPSGTLWPNDRKTSDKHPDYTGKIAFDEDTIRSLVAQLKAGQEPTADLSGWKKESRASGKKFLSLTAKPPYVKDGQGQASNRSSGGGGWDDAPRRPATPKKPDPFDDDLPF